ncbi:MAG: hypothetical protein QOJ29_4509, partial [Thermoleophilaceae bacterium]|nr:hypothetical protein [Thermoleophilaceae bacterium]
MGSEQTDAVSRPRFVVGLAASRRGPRLGFAARLVVALSLTLAFVGALGYWEVSRLLSRGVVKQEAAYNRAQAEAMEVATGGSTREAAIREVDTMIDVTSRPGIRVTVLIDSASRIVASADDRVIGHRDTEDPRIAAALTNGVSYAGREADLRHDAKDFEFITPIELAGHRYVLEATYGHAAFDRQLNGVRRWIALVVMLGLVGGGGIFYLLGGRSLLRSHRRALQRATLDGLTDLGNHLAFQVDIDRAVALAARQGEALALALVDLDDFKFLNDRHGHRHGDELLLRVGKILGQARVSDRAFRIGGDEFALLLPGTDVHGAGVLVRRLQRAFIEADVAVSIGLSTLELGEDAPTLREEADAALGEAKRRGGHAMVVYEDIRGTV